MRLLKASFLLAALVAAALFWAVPSASAAPATAFLTMHSDPGDFIGGGGDFHYTRPYAHIWANGWINGSSVNGRVSGLQGDEWRFVFDAPDNQPLQPGRYADAQESPWQEPGHPGIDIDRGFTCVTMTGEFTVLEIGYDADGRISRFRATFEQHCNGATAALRGEVLFTSPPPQPQLALAVKVNKSGTVDPNGFITLKGSVTCNQYVRASVSFSITQGTKFSSGSTAVGASPGWSSSGLHTPTPAEIPSSEVAPRSAPMRAARTHTPEPSNRHRLRAVRSHWSGPRRDLRSCLGSAARTGTCRRAPAAARSSSGCPGIALSPVTAAQAISPR